MPLLVKIGEGLILLKEDAAAALETIYSVGDHVSVSIEWLDGISVSIPELKALAVSEISSREECD